MKILQLLTSHDQLGNTGRKTGFWLEGAAPYFVFRDAGVDLTLASPKGGQPPIDTKSDLPENQTPAMSRFSVKRSRLRAMPTSNCASRFVLAHSLQRSEINEQVRRLAYEDRKRHSGS